MEKTGTLLLTASEAAQVASGIVPERIAQDWKLSLEELRQMIGSNSNVLPANPGEKSPQETPSGTKPGFHSPYTKKWGY